MASTSSTSFVGCDPGLTGAIAIISLEGRVLSIEDLKGDKGKLDTELLRRIVFAIPEGAKIALEDVHSMPTDGVVATHNFGKVQGCIEATFQAMGYEYDLISPSKWKGRLGLPGKLRDPDAKRKAREMAIHWFPDARDQLKRQKDHNRAEALLLAHYLRINDYDGLKALAEGVGPEDRFLLGALLGTHGTSRRRKFRGRGIGIP